MVQSMNTKAFMALLSIARRPGLLVPHVSVDTISDINYTALKEFAGIEAVLFDKDNTITKPYCQDQIHSRALRGIQQARQVFGHDKIAILSNSAGTYSDDADYKDALEIEEKLQIAVIRHLEKKPGGLQDVLEHFNMTDPTKLCIIGDRILTDIVFGNLYGMLTIHTLPLCTGSSSVTASEDAVQSSNTNSNNDNNVEKDDDENDNSNDNWTAKLIRPMENKLLYNDSFLGRSLRLQRIQHPHWLGPTVHPLTLSSSQTPNDDTLNAPEEQQCKDAEHRNDESK